MKRSFKITGPLFLSFIIYMGSCSSVEKTIITHPQKANNLICLDGDENKLFDSLRIKEIRDSIVSICLNDYKIYPNSYKSRTELTGRKGKREFFNHYISIFDLTSPKNNNYNRKQIKFLDKHVYHFSNVIVPYTFSHILIIYGEEIVFFDYLNCRKAGDDITDVLQFLKEGFPDLYSNKRLRRQIKRYRYFGDYVRGMHDPATRPDCDRLFKNVQLNVKIFSLKPN